MARVTMHVLREVFVSPERPTVLEMMLLVKERLGEVSIPDRGTFGHAFQPSAEEQLRQFCDANGLIYEVESPSGVYRFTRRPL